MARVPRLTLWRGKLEHDPIGAHHLLEPDVRLAVEDAHRSATRAVSA
jgi:hypothetical protein